MKDITIKIRKKTWNVRFVKNKELSPSSCGECDYPQVDKPEIWVKRNLQVDDLFDTTIHETIHASLPYLDELEVERGSTFATGRLMKKINKKRLNFSDECLFYFVKNSIFKSLSIAYDYLNAKEIEYASDIVSKVIIKSNIISSLYQFYEDDDIGINKK